LARKGATQVNKLALKLESKALKGSTNKILAEAQKKLSKGQISKIYKNTAQVLRNEAQEKLLKATEQKMGTILKESFKEGAETVFGNLTKEIPEAFANFTKKSFKNNMSGYMDAAKTIFGGSMSEWAENIVGGLVDTQLKEGAKALAGPEEKKAIDKQIKAGEAIAGMDAGNESMKNMMQQMAKVAAEATQQMAAIDQAAQEAAAQATQAAVEQKLIEEVAKETDKVEKEILSKPVTGRGSFTGTYGGELKITLIPGGGSLNGRFGNEYGRGRISGSVSKNGSISAHVSGKMKWDEYDSKKDKTVTVKCNLSANMTGRVGDGRASGSYSGSCGPKAQSGGWSINW
jgi:hypothetical protein